MRRDSDIHGTVARAEEAGRPGGMAATLRARTREPHRRAERSGIVADLLGGRADRSGYALLLRNLLPVYQALEQGLERHRDLAGVRRFALPALYRAEALAGDLRGIAGADWSRALPLLPEGEAYAARVAAAAGREAPRLIGHAYVRYLGDLSGGQILRKLLARTLGLGPECLALYDFPAIADAESFKARFRVALDRAAREIAHPARVVDEAVEAFGLTVAVSEAVQSRLEGGGNGAMEIRRLQP